MCVKTFWSIATKHCLNNIHAPSPLAETLKVSQLKFCSVSAICQRRHPMHPKQCICNPAYVCLIKHHFANYLNFKKLIPAWKVRAFSKRAGKAPSPPPQTTYAGVPARTTRPSHPWLIDESIKNIYITQKLYQTHVAAPRITYLFVPNSYSYVYIHESINKNSRGGGGAHPQSKWNKLPCRHTMISTSLKSVNYF